jgi:phosphoribosylaminoimidazole-succinocarboxamide synthase|tara:strand:- start:147 stop:848 length:702 start_codon:yes stop_codon:yes gene_type:complete
MDGEKMKPIVDGKVKSVYQGVDPEQVLIHYHDKVTAGNGEKEDYPKGKGKINNDISCIIFKELEKAGIRTHFIQYAGPALMRCKKVDIIPIEVVVRNIADGSIVRQTTIPKDTVFNPPLIEFYLKDDSKNDPLLTEDRLSLMGYSNLRLIKQYARETNAVVSDLFKRIGITLVDFKIEFGTTADGKVVVADEISPDGCRLRNAEGQSMDKDLFRKEKGDIINAYQEILDKLKK